MRFKNIVTFSIFTFTCCLYNAQNSKLELFDSLTTYQYKALFIDKNGDTLTTEKVLLQSTGQIWSVQATQILANYTFFPDSLAYFFRDPRSKETKYMRISTESRSGVVENDSTVWIHPFRDNQYLYTEVAPFPQVRKNKLAIGNQWSGGILFIMKGWGKLKGRVKSTYYVSNMIEKKYNNELLSECWVIDAKGEHNKLGISTLNTIYHKDYGFLEMNYTIYNGAKIQFILENVTKL